MKRFHIPLLLLTSLACHAQQPTDSISVSIETQVSASSGKTPLWLNANKYGLSSLKSSNGYLRATAERMLETDSQKKWGLGYGLDLVGAYNYTSSIFVQQAYVEGRYKLGVLSLGAKQQKMELKDNELSSGSQCLGINARPIPQIRLGLNDYWHIPGLHDWLAFKGHISYGMMTDGNWEERFAKGTIYKWNKNTRYHEKAGYLRIGNEDKFPLTFTAGLEMAGQFGGTVYNWAGTDEQVHDQNVPVDLSSSLKSYMNITIGKSSADVGETVYQNSEGNTLGSWVAKLNWNVPTWEAGIYYDHYFEDQSGMFWLDYDGYGTGDEWNVKKDSKYFVYSLKDMLVGADLKLKCWKYINKFVFEFVNTRYQSGPVYHDHTINNSTHISGRDNYYNHSSLPGWQHWGQVIGNPLYLSPLYNEDGYIGTRCSRFKAYHFALAGDPFCGFHYKAKISYQKGWGSYDDPFAYPKENTSVLLEAMYHLSPTDSSSLASHFTINLAWGADFGHLRGYNNGWQLTVKYNLYNN